MRRRGWPVVRHEAASRTVAPGRKAAAWVALLFLGMNLIGCFWGFFGPVRVIAASLALQLGAGYGLVSGLAGGACMYYVLKLAPSPLAVPRSLDWLRRWPSIWALCMGLAIAGFGFATVAHTGTWVYSEAFGARASTIVTVSHAVWTKRGFCHQHYFADVAPFTSSIRLLCIDRRLSAGTRVRLDGLGSAMGLAVTGAYIANDA